MSNVTPEHCLDIINKFEVSEENKQNEVLGIEGENYVFMVFLLFFLLIVLRLSQSTLQNDRKARV